METNCTQKEILLFTNNRFSQKQWCNKEANNEHKFSAREQMEELCANGMINEILPELFAGPVNKKMYLWQIRPGFSFLQLEYGEFPLAIEKAKSIDPHNSLAGLCYN